MTDADTIRQNREPADWQERHSPTEAVNVRFDTAKRTTIEICRRRIVDARLWDAMRAEEQTAAERIYCGFVLISGPSLVKCVTLERVDGKTANGAANGIRDLSDDYWDWAKTAQRERVRVAEVLDILVFGKSCAQVDRERRQRKGVARGNLFDGLGVYCAMRGW